MPIYEYECRSCGHRFERLVLPSSMPAGEIQSCPSCLGENLQRLLSAFAVSSDATRQVHVNRAKRVAAKEQGDKNDAEITEIKRHDH